MAHFTEKDFNSDEGMLTSVWGPPLWHTLHTISFNYPTRPDKATQRKYWRFVRSLGDVLPCRYCRENFGKNLQMCHVSKRHFRDRASFSRFIYDLHETVNTMLGKTSGLSYDKVRRRYENFRSRCLQEGTCEPGPDASAPPALEKGCTEPLYGKKSKCVLRIVPKESHHRTFAMDQQCAVAKTTGRSAAAAPPPETEDAEARQ